MDRGDRLSDFHMVGAARRMSAPVSGLWARRRRGVIAFAFAVTDTTVAIIGDYYGGRDIDAILAADDR